MYFASAKPGYCQSDGQDNEQNAKTDEDEGLSRASHDVPHQLVSAGIGKFRYTSKSGHARSTSIRQLCAISGQPRRSKKHRYSITSPGDCCSPGNRHKALPSDSLLKVNLTGQVVAPPNWRLLG
jgi:hypothetical protein